MSNTLPNIPIVPPPPPRPSLTLRNLAPASTVNLTTKQPLLEECLWSLEQPDLQKACFLARICTNRKPKSCKFYQIASILQVGPTCGLTALSMLLGGLPTADQLLHEAQRKRFSINGEMFSAFNLYQMICDCLSIINNNNNNNEDNADNDLLPCKQNKWESGTPVLQQTQSMPAHHKTIECQMYEGRLNCVKIKETLMQGACIFVPYDPDFNHSPCLKYGHKAHWALVIGYLIADNEEFFVIARHGKAKNLAVWSLQSLSDSNANLYEFAQPKGYPDCDFLLPPGGISGDLGLRERAIIVKGLPLEITTIS